MDRCKLSVTIACTHPLLKEPFYKDFGAHKSNLVNILFSEIFTLMIQTGYTFTDVMCEVVIWSLSLCQRNVYFYNIWIMRSKFLCQIVPQPIDILSPRHDVMHGIAPYVKLQCREHYEGNTQMSHLLSWTQTRVLLNNDINHSLFWIKARIDPWMPIVTWYIIKEFLCVNHITFDDIWIKSIKCIGMIFNNLWFRNIKIN